MGTSLGLCLQRKSCLGYVGLSCFTPVVCFRGCPQWPARRAERERHKRHSHVTHTRLAKQGWALQLPHWTQHGSWGFESESLPSLWHKAALISDGQITSLPPPEAHQTWAEAPAAYFTVLKGEHFMFSIAAVLLALHQLAPNLPAWQFMREGKETWPESMRKAEIMDFKGGSPLSDLQFHTPCQDSRLDMCHASKENPKEETQIFFSLLTIQQSGGFS